MSKKKNASNTQRANEIPDGKFTTTAPTCTCGTTMKEHYVARWHDKYICPRCDYFQGIPNTKKEYDNDKEVKK